MRDFKTLVVWQKAHQVALRIYKATADFPKEEIYGLTSQIRRAASSVPANIAEGCGRNGDVELGRFCHIAMGSASEVEYFLILATDLELIDRSVYDSLNNDLVEMKRMLNAFIQKLKANS